MWWSQTSGAYYFLDGEQHADARPEGPSQLHYRSTSRKQLDAMKKEKWNEILACGTTLPTEYIQRYSDDGMPTCKTYFTTTATPLPPDDSIPTVLAATSPAVTSTPVEPCESTTSSATDDSTDDKVSSNVHPDFASLGKYNTYII